MSRTILHIDLDAFFCVVEETQHPELRGKKHLPEEANQMKVKSCHPVSRLQDTAEAETHWGITDYESEYSNTCICISG